MGSLAAGRLVGGIVEVGRPAVCTVSTVDDRRGREKGVTDDAVFDALGHLVDTVLLILAW